MRISLRKNVSLFFQNWENQPAPFFLKNRCRAILRESSKKQNKRLVIAENISRSEGRGLAVMLAQHKRSYFRLRITGTQTIPRQPTICTRSFGTSSANAFPVTRGFGIAYVPMLMNE